MPEKKSGSLNWKRNLRRLPLVTLLMAGIMPVCRAQTPQPAASAVPPAPGYSDAEKLFARQIAALPPEDGLRTIASAESLRITEGLYRALKEIANQASAKDPQQAVAIFHESEATATRAGLPVMAADARFNQAFTMVADGETYEAIAVYSQALSLYQAADAPVQKMANVYLSRAVAALRLGDLQAAIADDNEALRIYRQTGDEVGLARAGNGLGNAYMEEGSFSDAEAAFSEALRIARAQGEKLGEAFVLNNMSMMHAVQGDYPMAVRFCEQSLEIKRQIGSKANVASSLINLADYYDIEGLDREANRALMEAAQIGRDFNLKVVTAKATAEMGVIKLEKHDPEAALKLLEEGYELGAGVEDQKGLAQTLNKIAEAYVDLKQYPQALQFSQKAEAIDRPAGILDQLADDDRVAGQVYLQMGELKEARKALEESIGAIEQMRNNLSGGAAVRQHFMAGRTDPYRLLTEVAATQGDWTAALNSAEGGKGRILLDLYTGDAFSTSTSLSDAERAEETRLRSRFLSLDMQFDRLASKADFDPVRRNELDASLQAAKTGLSNYREQLYGRHPEQRLRRASFTSLTAKDMQTLLPSPATALLEYELTPDGNYLFVITRGKGDSAQIRGCKLAVNIADLTRHVRRYREQLASRDPEFAAESRWLYNALLQPAEAQLKNAASLVVVPDGALWQVPFQALERRDGSFLVERAAITYVPSLAVLHALKSSLPERPGARSLLAMGNPDGHTQEQGDEALALTKLYGAKNARILIGKDATVAQFRSISAGFDVVHIAAHGIFNDREPLSSHMLLASVDGQPQAGWLRARDIQAMQLQAVLVVLSGCETGKGAFEDGEGLVGMSWATLAAGAHSSLASAWRVEASSTTEMMIAFHQNMLRGVNKAEALRRAELKLVHSGRYAHPFYWAAFVLMGDGTA